MCKAGRNAFLPQKLNKAFQLISQKKSGGVGRGGAGRGGAGRARGAHGEGQKIQVFLILIPMLIQGKYFNLESFPASVVFYEYSP